MSFIKATNLEKRYNTGTEEVHALDGVSFEIRQGEFVGVMGPSGSGKSTLLTVLGGLNRPSRSGLVVDGIDIYSLNGDRRADFRREYLGFVFQSFQLLPYLTVIENVELPLAATHLTTKQQWVKASAILEKVGIAAKASRLPDELSGGEQQRVAIARALVYDPPIVLADEPTGNLDSETSRQIMALFRDFHEDGQTIVMVTHNAENARYTDRCLLLRDGKLEDTPVFS